IQKIRPVEAPVSGPETDSAMDRGLDEEGRALPDEGDGHRVLFSEVARFSQGLKLLHLSRIAGRMGPAVVGLEGLAVISCLELEPEVVANRSEDAQVAIVADRPGSENDDQAKNGDQAAAEPLLLAPMHGDSREDEEDRKHREDGRVGEGGEAVRGAETQPGNRA